MNTQGMPRMHRGGPLKLGGWGGLPEGDVQTDTSRNRNPAKVLFFCFPLKILFYF